MLQKIKKKFPLSLSLSFSSLPKGIGKFKVQAGSKNDSFEFKAINEEVTC